MVRIVGIDPGSRMTGYGVIDFDRNRAVHVTSGRIALPDESLPMRLGVIFEQLGAILDQHDPAEMAVEQVFMSRNASSALKLGQARGAALLSGVTRGLAVSEYSPNQVKQAVTGKGHAEKHQMQHMVKALLCLPAIPAEDAADALAVAICHGHIRQTAGRVQRALDASPGGGRVRITGVARRSGTRGSGAKGSSPKGSSGGAGR